MSAALPKLASPQETIREIMIRADNGPAQWCTWYFHDVPASVLLSVIALLRGAEEIETVKQITAGGPPTKVRPQLKRSTRTK